MNTTLDQEHVDLRAAEYALGVLDAKARRAVEQEAREEPSLHAELEWWQQRLATLVEEVRGITPAPFVWARIKAELNLTDAARESDSRQSSSFWNNLRLWHWIGIGASAVAATCLLMLAVAPWNVPTPSAISAPYMVASITQDNGVAGWTATMDIERGSMVVVPATPTSVPSARAAELWLIPSGQQPISLGVIHTDTPTTVDLTPELVAQLGPQAILAVTEEPPGGSPTGAPTGTIIAKGSINAT